MLLEATRQCCRAVAALLSSSQLTSRAFFSPSFSSLLSFVAFFSLSQCVSMSNDLNLFLQSASFVNTVNREWKIHERDSMRPAKINCQRFCGRFFCFCFWGESRRIQFNLHHRIFVCLSTTTATGSGKAEHIDEAFAMINCSVE